MSEIKKGLPAIKIPDTEPSDRRLVVPERDYRDQEKVSPAAEALLGFFIKRGVLRMADEIGAEETVEIGGRLLSLKELQSSDLGSFGLAEPVKQDVDIVLTLWNEAVKAYPDYVKKMVAEGVFPPSFEEVAGGKKPKEVSGSEFSELLKHGMKLINWAIKTAEGERAKWEPLRDLPASLKVVRGLMGSWGRRPGALDGVSEFWKERVEKAGISAYLIGGPMEVKKEGAGGELEERVLENPALLASCYTLALIKRLTGSDREQWLKQYQPENKAGERIKSVDEKNFSIAVCWEGVRTIVPAVRDGEEISLEELYAIFQDLQTAGETLKRDGRWGKLRKQISALVNTLSSGDYQGWIGDLPRALRKEINALHTSCPAQVTITSGEARNALGEMDLAVGGAALNIVLQVSGGKRMFYLRSNHQVSDGRDAAQLFSFLPWETQELIADKKPLVEELLNKPSQPNKENGAASVLGTSFDDWEKLFANQNFTLSLLPTEFSMGMRIPAETERSFRERSRRITRLMFEDYWQSEAGAKVQPPFPEARREDGDEEKKRQLWEEFGRAMFGKAMVERGAPFSSATLYMLAYRISLSKKFNEKPIHMVVAKGSKKERLSVFPVPNLGRLVDMLDNLRSTMVSCSNSGDLQAQKEIDASLLLQARDLRRELAEIMMVLGAMKKDARSPWGGVIPLMAAVAGPLERLTTSALRVSDTTEAAVDVAEGNGGMISVISTRRRQLLPPALKGKPLWVDLSYFETSLPADRRSYPHGVCGVAATKDGLRLQYRISSFNALKDLWERLSKSMLPDEPWSPDLLLRLTPQQKETMERFLRQSLEDRLSSLFNSIKSSAHLLSLDEDIIAEYRSAKTELDMWRWLERKIGAGDVSRLTGGRIDILGTSGAVDVTMGDA